MALDQVVLNQNSTVGAAIGVDNIGGVDYEVVKQAFGTPGSLTVVDAANPLPVTDAAAETSLAAILAKIIVSPATEITLAAVLAQLVSGIVVAVSNFPGTQPISGNVAVSNFPATQPISAISLPLATGATTETTLAAILAKIIAAPATATLQSAGNTSLASIDGKLTNPLPVSGTVTVDTSALATQTTLAAILAKIIAAPSTAANQATEIASLANLDVALSTRLKPADTLAAVTAVTAITNALPAGTNILGKVGIDQTTPGTTNGVQVNAGTAEIGNVKNSGTFAVQATPVTQADTFMLGGVNVKEINAVTPLMGAGNTGTGSLRVTVATDQAVIPIDIQVSSSSTGATSNATSTAYEASRVIKAGVGRLYQITGYNSKTSSQFIQLHNATSLPADTAVPVITFTVAPQSNFSLDFAMRGRYFSTGIVICNSSTGATKTIASADCWFDCQFL